MRRTGLSALAIPATAVISLVWAAVGCGLTGAGPSATATATLSATPTAVATAISSPAPTPQSETAAPPTTRPRPSGAASQPPGGLLGFDKQNSSGLLGSYCWTSAGKGICADYPGFTEREAELPGVTLSEPDSQLHFQLDGKHPFAAWSASYIDATGNALPLGSGGKSFDPDASSSMARTTEVDFPPPPGSGAWIVQVAVRFAEGGDAIYGWNVTVP